MLDMSIFILTSWTLKLTSLYDWWIWASKDWDKNWGIKFWTYRKNWEFGLTFSNLSLLFEPKLDPNLQAWAWVHACGNPTKPWNLEYTLTGSWSEVAIFGAQNVAKVQVFFTCTTRIMASRAHIALSQKKIVSCKGTIHVVTITP
jgi:hypothetical protein